MELFTPTVVCATFLAAIVIISLAVYLICRLTAESRLRAEHERRDAEETREAARRQAEAEDFERKAEARRTEIADVEAKDRRRNAEAERRERFICGIVDRALSVPGSSVSIDCDNIKIRVNGSSESTDRL